MKTFVVNKAGDTQVPFLRGILTRSLLDAGLSFDDAFEVATEIRKELADVSEISSDELRNKVLAKLEKGGRETALAHYRKPVTGPSRIFVHSSNGNISAFSRGRHERYLQSSGIRTVVSEEITARIYEHLLARGVESINTDQLGYLTYLCLKQEVGAKAAKRYLVWAEFQRSERPLLLLIGGAVGTGKSSFATEIAHRLDIVRIQSTDMLREVMRMMLPKRLVPIIHTSSFNAWKALPIRNRKEREQDQLVEEGFRSQAELLSVPCEAVLKRAERESVSLILEGVHALPELLERRPKDSDVLAIHVTLAVLSSSELESRLRGRSVHEPKRHTKKYLRNFKSIWSLQSFLLSEADRYNKPIITNDDREKAVFQVITTVNEELARHFHGSPLKVFGLTPGSDAEPNWRKFLDRVSGA